ncbi:hypothetical protein FH972_026376 [Carpinus fangiana]|uniref:Uncharacterized protein n=1 Tax=Carpinus fangiana TaxID=176857 RepID=A0A5N6L4A7_9ROSI|nr:hypothetical protein FH972_026376 [Carpinus fangiana]
MLSRTTPFGALLGLFALLTSADLPYNPTRLFLSSKADGERGFIYQLDSPSSEAANGRLRSISLDSNLNSASIPYDTITPSLPFLENVASAAYISSANPDGGISTYAGDCAAGAQAAQLWRFVPNNSSNTAQGAWAQQTLSSSGAQTRAAPNLLASSITFSPTTLEKDASVYVFGGMCPDHAASQDSWARDASYSNQLVQLQPSGSNGGYVRSVMAGLGQPIAEAGFTITPLMPAFSNSTGGVLSQQQSFLLLGGHTQTAFINMSQVAIFSLPEATWTFLPIGDASSKTDLKERADLPDVEPRSGHTSILSSDGSKVIVLGGWVGDISTPAEPQLAVLNVGQGYGGSSTSWTWVGADPENTPFSDVSGIYGHGAVLLPGNVMMVSGGYSISASSPKAKRAEQTPSDKTLFYNITSATFMDSYDVKMAASTVAPNAQATQGPLTTTSQKAGLGVGLTLGIIAVALACLLGWWYWRRLKRRRAYEQQFAVRDGYGQNHDNRQSMMQQTTAFSDRHIDEKATTMRHSAWNGAATQRTETDSFGHVTVQQGWSNVREAERTGLDLNVPSPQRGLRKGRGPLTSHSINAMDPRANNARGTISPIDERPEDDSAENPSSKVRRGSAIGDDMDVENPFRDPDPEPPRAHLNNNSRRQSLTPSREGLRVEVSDLPGATPHEPREHETQAWTRDWKGNDLDVSRRGSPEKSERTNSSLSEQSQGQAETWRSSRYLQYIPAALNPFASPSPSPDNTRRDPTNQVHDSFYTARTSMDHLPPTNQLSEYEATVEVGDHGDDSIVTPTHKEFQIPHSHNLSSPISPDSEPTFTYPTIPRHATEQGHPAPRAVRRGGSSRIGSWVGSVRRTLAHPTSSYQRSASMNSISAANYYSNNYHNPTGGLVDADQYTDDGSASTGGGRSSSSSPTKLSSRYKIKRKPVLFGVPTAVGSGERERSTRRVVSESTGDAFWAASNANSEKKIRHSEDGSTGGQIHSVTRHVHHVSEDIDLSRSSRVENFEGRADKDNTQKRVMFSITQEKLRVVNRGLDDDDDSPDEVDSVVGIVTETTRTGVGIKSAMRTSRPLVGKVEKEVKRIEEASLKDEGADEGVLLRVDSGSYYSERSPALH